MHNSLSGVDTEYIWDGNSQRIQSVRRRGFSKQYWRGLEADPIMSQIGKQRKTQESKCDGTLLGCTDISR